MHEEVRILAQQTRAQIMRGLRTAVLCVTAAILCGLSLSNLIRYRADYEPFAVHGGVFLLFAGVLVAESILLVRRADWGRLRLPVLAAVLLGSLLSYLALPDGRVATYTDWVFGAANWIGAVLLLDRPRWALMAFLGAHEAVSLGHLVVFDEADRTSLLRLATSSIGIVGYPLCVAGIGGALHRIARTAAHARWAAEQARTEEATALALHLRRQQRFAELADTTVPLLRGLLSRHLDPEDPSVRQRSAIEAARMRRLFAELDVVADPLLHELRNCVDVAERNGVLVELTARGRWPELPVPVRRELTEAPLAALAVASSHARVSVIGGEDFVSVSVVADGAHREPAQPALPGVRLESHHHEDRVWVEVRWQADRSQR